MFGDRWRLPASRTYLLMGAWGGFAWALIATAYALYYINVARLDALELVLVGTALETSYFICEIPTGILADSYSRRFSIIVGLALIGIAWSGQALFPLFLAIAGFEVLRGLGEAFVHGATEAWISGEVGDDAIGPLFLREAQVSQAAGFVGLPIGVGLGLVDIRIPIVIGGLLTFALAIALIVLMPERRHPRAAAAMSWRASVEVGGRALASIRLSGVLAALLGAELFWGAASEGYDRLWEIHLLRDLAFPPFGLPAVVAFGALSLVATVIVIASAQAARRLASRGDERVLARILVIAEAARVGARVMFAFAPALAVALIPFFAESVLRAGLRPLFSAWLVRRTQEDVRATVLSATSVASALGQVGGGPVSGAVGRAYGVPFGLLSSAVLLVPGVFFLRRATRSTS